MKTNPVVSALLALEDDPPDALFRTIPATSIQLWPLLRTPLANAMAEQHQQRTFGAAARVPRGGALLRALREQAPHRRSSRSVPTATDLFVVSGSTVARTSTGTDNWLVDDFARATSDAVVLQDLPLGSRAQGMRPNFGRTYTFADGIARVTRRVRSRPLPQGAVDEIARTFDEIIGHTPFRLDAARARGVCQRSLYRARRAAHTVDEFARVLDRAQPARVVVQGAAYGDRSPLIALAKSRGIAVLEPQHGWIGVNHTAYNFGAAMRDPRLARTLPDALMTFGEYWGDSVRFPGATPAIGKPSLERAAETAPPLDERAPAVLIVSSRFDDERLIALTLRLRALLPPEWSIFFRPHPGERAEARTRYPALDEHPGIRFDDATDVNDSLRRARAVVGFSSTVLFEALAFGCHVEVIDSTLADEYVAEGLFGDRIGDDPRPAAARILASPAPQTDLVGRLWQPDAVANYRLLTRGDGAVIGSER